jgi:two-component system, OmpR family, response regulator CpxR
VRTNLNQDNNLSLAQGSKTDKSTACPAQRVLVVDDDVELCELVAEYLAPDGFHVTAVHNGIQGAERALSGEFALIVLDLMLPGIEGYEVLRRIRSKSRIPVIMLSARGEDSDRIRGLETGADDYVPKPFNPRELAARIHAVLRRTTAEAAQIARLTPGRLVLGDVTLDAGARLVRCGNREVDCTSVEFDLLEMFLKTPGRVILREELSRVVLGRELGAMDRSIDVHVSNLRKKLGPLPDGGERIKPIRSAGYLYVISS